MPSHLGEPVPRRDGKKETYTMIATDINNVLSSGGEKQFCHGWEANVEENVCYFTQDTLTELADKSVDSAHYVGTEITQLGQDQLRAMGWTGGNKEANTTSVDIDCSGADGDCSNDEKVCGWIWWQDGFRIFGNGEYKMGVACPEKNGTSKRCVLLEPLKFHPQTEIDGPNADPGEGYIDKANAKCIE